MTLDPNGRYSGENDDHTSSEFDARAIVEIEQAVNAVCDELGVDATRKAKRAKIASGIASTWRDGRRHPLNLVNAGLDAVCC